jgi:DinB superfamily
VRSTSSATIRLVYSMWPQYNRRLRDVIAAMTDEQLAIRPSPERWPIWATVGHTACQRVFWLCDFAGESGTETTPFTNAAYDCPGDDDLDHPLNADQLVEALDSSFRIIENCMDQWTVDMLAEELHREMGGEEWVHTRGSATRPTIVASCRRHWGSPGCRRSTSGTEERSA